jgi:hypothetical protein
MATIRIKFDGGNVPVLVGAEPDSPNQPIANPTDTGYTTNTPFIVTVGIYCFGLRSNSLYTPLWQIGQAVDGTQLELEFKVLP